MTRKDDGFSQLAVLKCLVDEGTAALKAGGWGIRDAADEYMEDRWNEGGSDRQRIYVNGEEVGTMTARVSKRREVAEPRVTDVDALCDWLMDPSNDDARRALRSLVLSDPKKALRYAMADGLLPDGAEVVDALCDWLMDPSNDDARRALRSLVLSDPKKALRYAMADGLLPDGAEVVDRVEPAGRFEGTTLRVDAAKVRAALGCDSVLVHLIGEPKRLDGGDGR